MLLGPEAGVHSGCLLNWVDQIKPLEILFWKLQGQQSMWLVPDSGRWDKKGRAGSKKRRQSKLCGRGAWASTLSVAGGAPGAQGGLDDHGLQQAEAHHEVQPDGRFR